MDADGVVAITEEFRKTREGRIIRTRKIGEHVLDVEDVTQFYFFVVSRPESFQVSRRFDPERW